MTHDESATGAVTQQGREDAMKGTAWLSGLVLAAVLGAFWFGMNAAFTEPLHQVRTVQGCSIACSHACPPCCLGGARCCLGGAQCCVEPVKCCAKRGKCCLERAKCCAKRCMCCAKRVKCCVEPMPCCVESTTCCVKPAAHQTCWMNRLEARDDPQ